MNPVRQIAVLKRTETVITLSIEELAGWFCEMTDDDQAQFFIEVGKVLKTWTTMARDNQPYYIGKHLAECECGTPEAREFIENIYKAIHNET